MNIIKHIQTIMFCSLAESIYFHLLLSSHLWLLFHVCGAESFGKIATIFSLIYFFATLIDGGYAWSLGPFFKKIQQSRTSCRTLLASMCMIQAAWIVIMVLLIHMLYPSFFDTLPYQLMSLCMGIEVIRRPLRSLCRLGLYYKQVAWLDGATITIYVIATWITYLLAGIIHETMLLYALAFSSGCTTLCLIILVYQWYRTLEQADHSPSYAYTELLAFRWWYGLYEISVYSFSHHSIIPALAWYHGYGMAGAAKLASTLWSTVHALSRELIGSTALITFSRFSSSITAPAHHVDRPVISSYYKIVSIFAGGACVYIGCYAYSYSLGAVTTLTCMVFFLVESVTTTLATYLFTQGYSASVSITHGIWMFITCLGLKIVLPHNPYLFLLLCVIGKVGILLTLLISRHSILFYRNEKSDPVSTTKIAKKLARTRNI